MKGADRVRDDKFPAERLLREYGDGLLRTCRAMLGDLSAAEDAVQDTFLRAWRGWARFRGDASEKTWLYGIAMNVCRSMLRRRHVTLPLDELDGALAFDPPEPSDGEVLRAVQSLEPKYREVVLLFYYHDMSTAEIAKTLGLKQSNVTARLTRARDQLRTKLKGWYFDE